MSIGRERLEVRAGDAVFLLPGQDHALLSESPDFELFVLALDPHLSDRCALPAPRRAGVVSLTESNLASVREQWLGLAQVSDGAAVETVLCDHFLDLIRRFDLAPSLCRRTVQTLQTAPETTEEHVASMLGAHPSDVSRAVRQGLGMRLVEFRTHVRLIAFVRCVDSGASLTSAAFQSGFGSYTQLHRVFRKHLGCAPAEYFGGRRHHLDALLSSDVE